MQTINSEVTYLNELDLNLDTRKLLEDHDISIHDVTLYDVMMRTLKDKMFYRRCSIIIVKYNGDYKVLKSKF